MTAKPLRLLLDENIGYLTAKFLRDQGYDVVSVLEDHRGASDQIVLQTANQDQRLLITLDRDFGQLIFQHAHKHVGVIYLRLDHESTEVINKVTLDTLTQFSSKLQGKFVVASEVSIRIRQ